MPPLPEWGVRRRGWRGPPAGQAEGGPGPGPHVLGAREADPGTLRFDGGGGGPGAAPNLGSQRGVRGQRANGPGRTREVMPWGCSGECGGYFEG